jgi:hypothetical protein
MAMKWKERDERSMRASNLKRKERGERVGWDERRKEVCKGWMDGRMAGRRWKLVVEDSTLLPSSNYEHIQPIHSSESSTWAFVSMRGIRILSSL